MTEAIRDANEDSFAELIEPHPRELHAHHYRILGSVHDADDALQEVPLGAWKGRSGFEGRSSLPSWLYTIATNASLRILERRKRRELPGRTGSGDNPRAPLAEPPAEPVWIESFPTSSCATRTARASSSPSGHAGEGPAKTEHERVE